jgi:hypothetical protein
MKTLVSLALLATAGMVNAGPARVYTPVPSREAPPPTYVVPAPVPARPPAGRETPPPEYVYEQRLVQSHPVLVPPEHARDVANRFREAYPALGSPRIFISVNRQVTGSGSAARGTARTREETLADRQTLREIERLFGRPLRAGGATLADGRAASDLLGGRSIRDLLNRQGNDHEALRQALGQMADVVVEILISSRDLTVDEISGPKVYTVPDIQATAIRLKDSDVIGQASANDIIGPDRFAAPIVRTFSAREIAEATALALMEDMLLPAP